jgi:uncharacterized protein with beta-barrel porin domain
VVNGSISDPIIGAGGVLSGIGAVGPTTINSGGTLAPGPVGGIGTLTVNGALTFNSGSTYAVMLTPSTSSSTAVNGAATLSGGFVNAQFGAGTYGAKQYTILTTTGGVGGTTFAGLTTSLPNFQCKPELQHRRRVPESHRGARRRHAADAKSAERCQCDQHVFQQRRRAATGLCQSVQS